VRVPTAFRLGAKSVDALRVKDASPKPHSLDLAMANCNSAAVGLMMMNSVP
jgi:hypothetical protein